MIRPMTRDDIPAAARLEAACFSDAWSEKLIGDSMDASWNHFFAAEEEGAVVGYSVLCLVAGEGEIQRIAVCPDLRRRGMGRKLMEAMAAFARAQGADALTLEVRESNLAARSLYKSCGFREEAVRRGYYRSPKEDAVICWNRTI